MIAEKELEFLQRCALIMIDKRSYKTIAEFMGEYYWQVSLYGEATFDTETGKFIPGNFITKSLDSAGHVLYTVG